MQKAKFPCPWLELHDCMDGICVFCCGIGTKHIDDQFPRNLINRKVAIQKYREYQDGEK